MGIIISKAIAEKLEGKHRVTSKEIEEAFDNRTGKLLYDTREEHATDPRTMWFIALTNHRRLLKVCFIQRGEDTYIRTAYSANEDELRIYRAHGKPSDF
jgi:uncharacterized DUF497 family protein